MKSPPLAQVKQNHGEKAKLLASVQKLASDKLWLKRGDAEPGLERLSNAKLLRLERVLGQVQKDFGSREALIKAILEQEKRSKDTGYKERLEKMGDAEALAALAANGKLIKRPLVLDTNLALVGFDEAAYASKLGK